MIHTPAAWSFKEAAAVRPDSQTITIPGQGSSYKVIWRYSQPQNAYIREMAGALHTDRITNAQIAVRTVIVQKVVRAEIKSADGKAVGKITTKGTGSATIFSEGTATEVTWKRTGNERTRYFLPNGDEFQFVDGPIWIRLFPTTQTLTVE